jgi:hypothetical protein
VGDAGAREAGDVGCDVGRPTGVRVARPVRRVPLGGLAAAGRQIGLGDGARIAARLRQLRFQERALLRVPLGRVERLLWVVADGIPAVAEPGHAAQRHPALAAHPDRRARLLNRLRLEADVGERHVLAREARRIARPELVESRQELVRHRSALREGRRGDRAELLVEPPDTDADGEPSLRQHVDGGQRLGGQHCRTLWHHHHGGDEADAARRRGEEAECRHLFQALTGAGARPFTGRRIGIAGGDAVGHDDVVVGGDVTEAQRLRPTGHRAQSFGVTGDAAGQEVDSEIHRASFPSFGPRLLALGQRLAAR